MSIFPMDPETIARVKARAELAARPENWYRPFDPDYKVPGEQPGGQLVVGMYTVVFTWSVARDDGKVFRHMSVRAPRGYPSPMVVYTLASWLGYTGAVADVHGVVHGPAEGWTVVVNAEERTIVVGEAIEQ